MVIRGIVGNVGNVGNVGFMGIVVIGGIMGVGAIGALWWHLVASLATGIRLSPSALGRLARELALPEVCSVLLCPSAAPLHACVGVLWVGDG